MLEKFKDQTVLIHHKLNVPINLDCYYSYQNALLGVKKVASIPLNHHASQPIFVSPLSDDKVPKPSQGGHYLSGSVAFIKDSDLKKIVSLFRVLSSIFNCYNKVNRIESIFYHYLTHSRNHFRSSTCCRTLQRRTRQLRRVVLRLQLIRQLMSLLSILQTLMLWQKW